MTNPHNPALEWFARQITRELVMAQIRIRRNGTGFEITHINETNPLPKDLSLPEVRALAQFTESGTYRPLKSSPDLRFGWRLLLQDAAALGQAVNQIYPGAIADCFAAQRDPPPVTHYRSFTARQTGMYRITAMLDDTQAARVIRACCHPGFCLKARRWTVEGLPADTGEGKSVIPCLEPCAVLLEFARKGIRMEQQNTVEIAFSKDELESLICSVKTALLAPPGSPRA